MATTISNFPAVKVEVAFASNPMASPVWTDITTYVRSLSIRRGRQDELSRVEAGTCTFTLNNRDRRFDPTHTTGAYYPNVLPLKRVRVSAVWNSVTYYLFTGYVERWPQRWTGPKDGYVTVTAVDGFEPLNQALVSASFPEQNASARVSAVLDNIGWSATDRNVSTGQSTFAAITLDKVSALQHLSDAADSELGLFFFSGDGKATFHDRHKRLKPPYTTSSGTFTDATGVNYTDLVLDYSKDRIYNYVAVTRQGGTEQTASDATSQTTYFKRSYTRSPLIASDVEAAAMAEFLVYTYDQPQLEVKSITLNGRMDSANNLWPQILGRELSDRITVTRTPPGGGSAITGDHFIESVSHDVTGGKTWKWTTTWALSPSAAVNGWLLGTSTLGTSTILVY